MFAAFLTAVFFAFSAIFANRSLRLVGAARANLGRLIFAAICLGLYAHLAGGGLRGAGRNWLLLSGVIGLGLGDVALYLALPLLGSRLAVLMTQCLAAPVAMLAERLWLGTRLGAPQLLWSFVVLSGVAVALLPSRANPPRVRVRPVGFLFGVLSASGQGFGAVVSRKGNAIAALAGEPVDGITAAYQRILGGLVVALAWFALRAFFDKKSAAAAGDLPSANRPPLTWRSYLWVPVNALCGAVIGVSCYQWALATTPSGIVLPIVACTPLVIVPLSYWFDGERPTRRSLLGGVIAVAGCVALTVVR
jgi:drug/metabolite transporter (DMT)-like permease